jgi:DNA-binding MarR family transcriptional regulator
MAGYNRAVALRDNETEASPDIPAVVEYKRAISLVERLHRQLLDVVKHNLDKTGHEELTAVQALLIYNIGDAEWSAGELKTRGCYLGSNVSYNLKKLQELGYLASEKSSFDKRQTRVALTADGRALRAQIDSLFNRHGATVRPVGGIETDDLERTNRSLGRLERFWVDQVRFKLS